VLGWEDFANAHDSSITRSRAAKFISVESHRNTKVLC